MLRVTIDTSVIVAALRSKTGAGNKILRLVALRKLVPLMTTAMFLEYEEVLKRSEQRLAHGPKIGEIDQFLSGFLSASEAVEIEFQWRPQLPDTDDEMIFEAAVNGRADALVTYNVKDFREAAKVFGLRVLLPGDLLAEIGAQ
jgi:putative PIN family toxin of toxin-antitoxin system